MESNKIRVVIVEQNSAKDTQEAVNKTVAEIESSKMFVLPPIQFETVGGAGEIKICKAYITYSTYNLTG
jgi:hypothetical protein